MQTPEIYELIDLDRYPLDSEAGQRLIAETQASLEKVGCCSLPGFEYIALRAAGGGA